MQEEKRKKHNKLKSQETKQGISPTSSPNSKNPIQEPILNQLFFQIFETGIPLPEKHPISISFDFKPNITKYYVLYVKSKSRHSNLNENPPEICFWQNENINANENPAQFTALIRSQFSSLIEPEYIFDFTNKDKKIILQELKNYRRNRLVFHYMAHDIEQDFKNGLSIINNNEIDSLPINYLLEYSSPTQIFTFDCDNSGALLSQIIKYQKEKNKNGKNEQNDQIFFFSCSEGESMPRSSDYPTDLFTSCLTSPSRIALLWHSRHYFCFQSGCLQPLPTFFVEDMVEKQGQIKKLLYDLKLALKSTVESMALENMEAKLFIKLFRTNRTYSDLCVNYFLACRILSYFNIHPVSYPELPDLNECSQWHTFDLRLDETLCLLSSSKDDNFVSLSYHLFLSQTLLSMKTLVNLTSVKKTTAPFELSFFPDILNDPELSSEACEVLAKYFDSLPDAIYCSLFYPIPQNLFSLLHQFIMENRNKIFSSEIKPTINSNLIFCIIKIVCYYRDSIKQLIQNKWEKGIIDDLLPYLKNKGENSDLLSILIALLMKDLTFKDYQSLCDIDVDQYDDDTKRWLLMLFSYAIPNINDYSKTRKILDKIVKLSQNANTELQISIICSLFGFIKTTISKNMTSSAMLMREENENIVIETALKFSKSVSFVVRRELLIFLKNFKKIHFDDFDKPISQQEPNYQLISLYLLQCESDPNDNVRNEVKKEQSTSIVFDTYVASLLLSFLPLVLESKPISFSYILRSLSENPKEEKPVQHRTTNNIRNMEKYSKYTMKVTSLYKHLYVINSNLLNISLPQDKIVFGDSNGNVCIKNWNNNTINAIVKVANEPITDVQYVNNNGCPLIFSATENGNCFVTSINEKYTSNKTRSHRANSYNYNRNENDSAWNENKTEYETSFRASFQLFPDVKFPCHMHQAIDEKSMRFYSYAPYKSFDFKIRDLRSDQYLASIKTQEGETKSLLIPPKMDDVICFCGKGFESYDLRVSNLKPQIYVDDFDAAPFMMQFIDESVPIFAIVRMDSSVTKLDIRCPRGGNSIPYYSSQYTVAPSAFATYKFKIQMGRDVTNVAALSNNLGISIIDFYNYGQEVMPQNSKIMKIANSSALAFHPHRYELSLVNNNNYILHMKPDQPNNSQRF